MSCLTDCHYGYFLDRKQFLSLALDISIIRRGCTYMRLLSALYLPFNRLWRKSAMASHDSRTARWKMEFHVVTKPELAESSGLFQRLKSNLRPLKTSI